MRPAREGECFTLLGRVGFDNANASERFSQTSGERRRNLATLAE